MRVQVLWSAGGPEQAAGATQLSVYLSAGIDAVDVERSVTNWLLVQQDADGTSGFWHSTKVTVREVSSEILHILFYMPASAQQELHDVVVDMLNDGDSGACHTFNIPRSTTALVALTHMLQRQGLQPGHFILRTKWLRKELDIELLPGMTITLHKIVFRTAQF